MTIFGDLANAVASLLGTTPEVAGWILGFVTITALFVALLALLKILGDVEIDGIALLFPAAIPMVFVWVTGWWPPWALVALFVILIFIIVQPFTSGRGGGGAP